MILERIESEGLAHYSYLLADRGQAVIVDPRRDCDAYADMAARLGLRVTHIFETHRNEDYLVGSPELATLTGAEIWHADGQMDYKYGNPVEDGQRWKLGGLEIEAIHTPGHTPGHMSYLIREAGGNPWLIFCGDALFAGEVGRVDLMGMDKAKEMAGLLFDTIFHKILPLGDGVLACPAHGAGSVCGAAISSRVWTTLGLERKINPRLVAADRDDFVASAARELERPPYFRRMERLNLEGPPPLRNLPRPVPMPPDEFDVERRGGQVLDTRMETAFGSAHVPGSLSIWLAGLPAFAGWFLPQDRPVMLVQETGDDSARAVRALVRMGYDDISGVLAGGVHAWLARGKAVGSVGTLSVQELCRILDGGNKPWILDVRSDEELEQDGRIPSARHIPITRLPGMIPELPKDRTVHIFCGSGLRSMIAASLLKRAGWERLAVILGGTAGWTSFTCPIEAARGLKMKSNTSREPRG